MSDAPSGDADEPAGARMLLGPDAIHESNDGELSLDCPKCGSTVSFEQVVVEGRCDGRLDADVAEVESDDEQLTERGCTAELSLELVWEG